MPSYTHPPPGVGRPGAGLRGTAGRPASRRDPDGGVEILKDGLQFANGVALAFDESLVMYAETGSYRPSKAS